MKKTMRIEIGTQLYNKVIQCIERGKKWSLEGAMYNITGATRIDCTDFVRVELEQVVIK